MGNPRQIARKALEKIHFAPCEHFVSAAFQKCYTAGPKKLPKDDACPQCLIFRINHTLFALHQELRLRGGCFRSMDLDLAIHQKLRSDWNTATIHGLQVFGILEEFVKGKVTDLDRQVAETAMRHWATYRKKIRVMPGMERIYPDGRDEEDTEVSSLVKSVSRILVLVKQVEEEAGSNLAEEIAKTLPVPPTAADIIAYMKANAIAKESNTPPPSEAGSVRRSILKSQHTLPRSSTPKKVRLENFASISSDHHALVRSPFPATPNPPLPCEVETAKHSLTALFLNGRDIREMLRSSSRYLPGRWKSPVGLEKQNTSWSMTGWDKLYSEMRDEEREWVKQLKEAERAKGVDL